ncbi:MAG: hypothetical protein ACTSWY_05655 [Promethearchaeota archaeon]
MNKEKRINFLIITGFYIPLLIIFPIYSVQGMNNGIPYIPFPFSEENSKTCSGLVYIDSLEWCHFKIIKHKQDGIITVNLSEGNYKEFLCALCDYDSGDVLELCCSYKSGYLEYLLKSEEQYEILVYNGAYVYDEVTFTSTGEDVDFEIWYYGSEDPKAYDSWIRRRIFLPIIIGIIVVITIVGVGVFLKLRMG